MLRLYKSLIRSKLDYGCAIYGQTAKSYLRLLDPIQNEGLRIATGAFRSSPKESLEVEAGVLPLSLRREQCMCSLFLRLQIPTPSALTPLLVGVDQNPPYWPFAGVVTSIFRYLDLPLHAVLQYDYTDFQALWLYPPPVVCLGLSSFTKSEDNAVLLRTSFTSHLVLHAGSTHVYTDGSKRDSGVGASAVFPDLVLSHSLPPSASIFTAELVALALAVLRILGLEFGVKYTIFSDSKSALLALKDRSTRHPLVSAIQRFLCFLHVRKRELSFCWVPSHVGVPGNERADEAAGLAASSPMNSDHFLPRNVQLGHLPAADFQSCLRRGFLTCWQTCWTEDPRDFKLRNVKPILRNWLTSYKGSRRREVVLARLRIGHTNLTHSFLMAREAPPPCPFCRLHTPLSIFHIFVDCQAITALRSRFFPGSSAVPFRNRMAYILSESPHFSSDHLFAFLQELDILYKI